MDGTADEPSQYPVLSQVENVEKNMTTSEYAEKIVNLIQARPKTMDADKLLYEIYVKLKVSNGMRAVKQGRVYPHEKVREDMWKIIHSKSSGVSQRNRTSKRSSSELPKTRR
jgi:hypothetical protein